MSRKKHILNFFFTASFLFAVLYPSLHAAEHIAEEMQREVCVHHYLEGKTEVTHSHHSFEKCFSCDFTVGHFLSIDSANDSCFIPSEYFYPISKYYAADVSFLERTPLSYRGPPSVIA